MILAASSENIDLGFKIRAAYTMQSFLCRKAVACTKSKISATKLMEVVALDNTLIQPNSVCNIAVHAMFEGCEDWIIEKVIIRMDDQNVMAAPTTWIYFACLFISIVNPSSHPHYIQAGKVVGYLHNPENMIDKPKDEEHLDRMATSTEALQKTIIGILKAQDLASASNLMADSPGHEDCLEEDETSGPKTTAVPEDPMSRNVDQLVNLGPDIPEAHRSQLAEVLHRNAAAFSLNGRLGHMEA